MDVDSTMATEPESEQAATTEHFFSGESSSAPAAVPPPPYDLTPEAMKALGEEGSQVLVCLGSRCFLFRGSKELEGKSLEPLPAVPDDIFSDFDPKSHSLILQPGQRTFRVLRPTQDTPGNFKQVIAARAARYRRQRVNRKRNRQLRDKEGNSGRKPDEIPPSAINVPEPLIWNDKSRLIVIKKVAGNTELQTSHANLIPKPVNKKGKGSPMGVIFAEWNLRTAALPALPLLPSLSSYFPWFYIANPATSEGNHIFGNIATQQSMLVANSDLQYNPHLLYSKDGWLLFQGQQVVFSSDEKLGRYPVFLLNPTTGARIDLPGIRLRGGCAAFRTTTEGTPEVVMYVISMRRTVKVHMVRPGSACWEEHPYEFSHGPGSVHKMVLCGSSVYCFFKSHSIIFKLTDLSWHPVPLGSPYPNYLECVALEIEGKVVIVGDPAYFTTDRLACDPIRFFKMEMRGENFEWVEIAGSDEELDGRIWFINRLQSFSVKVAGSGQKMCWFARIPLIKQGYKYGSQCALRCLNLTTHTHSRLIADSIVCRQRAWVDLGCLSDRGLLDCGITGDDLLPGF